MRALITGATSGIGNRYAHALAARGYNLLLTGRRRQLLSGLADELTKLYAVEVDLCIGDLGTPRGQAALKSFAGAFNDVVFLVHNAGYGFFDSFDNVTLSDHAAMLRTHCSTSLMLCKMLLPNMKRHGSGDIILVSSVRAVFPSANSVTYSATKSFLNLLAEGMAVLFANEKITVQALMPGLTITDFHAQTPNWGETSGRQKRWPLWMHADTVVRRSLKALDRSRKRRIGKVCYIPGGFNKFSVLCAKFMPRFMLYALLGRVDKKFAGK